MITSLKDNLYISVLKRVIIRNRNTIRLIHFVIWDLLKYFSSHMAKIYLYVASYSFNMLQFLQNCQFKDVLLLKYFKTLLTSKFFWIMPFFHMRFKVSFVTERFRAFDALELVHAFFRHCHCFLESNQFRVFT